MPAIVIANKSFVNFLKLGMTVMNINEFLDEKMRHNFKKLF